MNPPPALPAVPFRKSTLANGLDVIVARRPALPLTAVNLWYHVGSKNEERRRRGFAHLFEHLMFEGSEHYPGDYFKPLQRIGAGINGSTSTDRTNYFADVPSAHAELVLAMESDRMANLLPALTPEKLRIQKDVVKNEYRQNYANRPYGQVPRLLAEALYPPNHPYSWLTIGVMEDVEAAALDDVEAFFRTYYVPSNASLAIVGDVDEDAAFRLAERYFADIPGGIKAARPWTPPAGLDRDTPLLMRDRVELDRLHDVRHTVPQFHDDDAPLALLGDVLARGRSSRLYRKLVLETNLAQNVSASQSGRELAGTFAVVVTLRPGRSIDEARAVVDRELQSVAEKGVTDEELDRARNGRLAGFVFALDNIGGFGGVADRLNAYNIHLGDPGRITSDFERYRTVAPDDLQRVAASHLHNKPTVRLDVVGRSPAATLPPMDRTVRPAPAPAMPFRAPTPVILTTAGGTPVWVIPRRELPIVAATLVLPVGAGAHGPDVGGLANLTAANLDEGTANRTAEEIALAVEKLGSSLSSTAGWDGSYVGLNCLTAYLDETLEVAADILRNPTFPEREWERLRGQTLAALQAERDSAEARAVRGLLKSLYPSAHPYRVPSDGTAESVARLSPNDARLFHERCYGAGRGAWIVAGDIDPDDMARRLGRHLEGWRTPAGSPSEPPETPRPERSRIILLDRPAAPQAVAYVGQVGVPRSAPDFHELTLWNHVLGGQFTARLNARLRESMGVTYGVRSRFDARRGAGPFSVHASIQADRLAESLNALREEVAALLDGRPPTTQEFDDARRSLIEGQARQFETPSALIARYAELVVHGLPPDEHGKLAERLSAVTPDSAVEAARRRLSVDSLVYVVVADADSTVPQLQNLGWADLEVWKDGREALG